MACDDSNDNNLSNDIDKSNETQQENGEDDAFSSNEQSPNQNNQRTNPFDVARSPSIDLSESSSSVAPEIEQQRASSILKDLNFKRSVLAQLVIASMELLESLEKEDSNNLRLLMTPTIREAFRQIQNNELKLV